MATSWAAPLRPRPGNLADLGAAAGKIQSRPMARTRCCVVCATVVSGAIQYSLSTTLTASTGMVPGWSTPSAPKFRPGQVPCGVRRKIPRCGFRPARGHVNPPRVAGSNGASRPGPLEAGTRPVISTLIPSRADQPPSATARNATHRPGTRQSCSEVCVHRAYLRCPNPRAAIHSNFSILLILKTL